MFKLNLTPKKLIAGAAVPVAVLASGGLVWQSSYSAFSATTASPTNNWAAGSVALADDDSNAAMFNASNLKPGSTGSKCLVVTSSGSLASTVKLYATNYSTTKSLADSLNLKVEEGTGGTFSNCTGFTAGSTVFDGTAAAFGTSKTDFATGVGTWAPNGGNATKTYKVTYTLNANTPDSAQGGTAAVGFTWESQNS
ncbi:MAG: TasA family protein [Marmoricola sp.]